MEELVEDVWYCGGGGGSFEGNPRGWTILIGFSLVVIGVDDDPTGWLIWMLRCTEDWITCFVGWFVCVIVIRFVLVSEFDDGGNDAEFKSIEKEYTKLFKISLQC